MILVLLGTYNIAFPRPLKAMEHFIDTDDFTEKIVVQGGYTDFQSKHFKVIPFICPEELETLYNEARLIITHAGTGSILQGVKKGKKVIAIARLKKYSEHIDDHQLEVLQEFVKSHYILAWNEGESFGAVLKKSESFVPAQYQSNKQNLINFLLDYIEKT